MDALRQLILCRFTTIMGFCALYAAGMLACCLAAHPGVLSGPLFFLGLFGGVAVGSGGIKPNVVVLGAEQVDNNLDLDTLIL